VRLGLPLPEPITFELEAEVAPTSAGIELGLGWAGMSAAANEVDRPARPAALRQGGRRASSGG
jgi:hypothetical protein